jgi:hypothetical protein
MRHKFKKDIFKQGYYKTPSVLIGLKRRGLINSFESDIYCSLLDNIKPDDGLCFVTEYSLAEIFNCPVVDIIFTLNSLYLKGFIKIKKVKPIGYKVVFLNIKNIGEL